MNQVVLQPQKRAACTCPKCNLNMRRTYVQGQNNTNGKRKTVWRAIGFYCPFCDVFISDQGVAET